MRQFATLNKRNKGLFIGDLSLSIYVVGHIQIEDPSLHYDIYATSDPLLFTVCYKIISWFTYGVMRINHGSSMLQGIIALMDPSLSSIHASRDPLSFLNCWHMLKWTLHCSHMQHNVLLSMALLQGILYCLCVQQGIILCSLSFFNKGLLWVKLSSKFPKS